MNYRCNFSLLFYHILNGMVVILVAFGHVSQIPTIILNLYLTLLLRLLVLQASPKMEKQYGLPILDYIEMASSSLLNYIQLSMIANQLPPTNPVLFQSNAFWMHLPDGKTPACHLGTFKFRVESLASAIPSNLDIWRPWLIILHLSVR